MEKEIYLSIVIPAYREEKRIHLILDAISRYEKKQNFEIEVIVVIDGQFDDTAKVAIEYEKVLPHINVIDRKENKGKGYSVREGVLVAKGRYILFADADNSTPIEQVDKLLKYAPQYEVVIGSRYCPGGKLARPQPIHRVIGGRVLNMIIQILAIWGIKDTQCGFKLFESKASKEIFKRQTFDRFSFDIELLAIARRLGYEIKEVGITWYDNPHSTVNPIMDGLQMTRDAWRVRHNIIAGKYK